jgi:hypothetical protein
MGMMSYKTSTKIYLLLAMIVLAAGGLGLHLRIHTYAQNHSNLVPLLTGIISIAVVPLLFLSKKTIGYGYVINGMQVIVGTITMFHFSLAHWPNPFTPGAFFLKTLIPDIFLLWGNFFAGKALFDLELHGFDESRIHAGAVLRYPNNGWWAVHLAGLSFVYWAGHALWR